MLVVRTPISNDKKVVYGWLRNLCDKFQQREAAEKSAARIVTIEDLLAFFR